MAISKNETPSQGRVYASPADVIEGRWPIRCRTHGSLRVWPRPELLTSFPPSQCSRRPLYFTTLSPWRCWAWRSNFTRSDGGALLSLTKKLSAGSGVPTTIHSSHLVCFVHSGTLFAAIRQAIFKCGPKSCEEPGEAPTF